MSATIKTNLNGSSNGCSLAALKKHINTCLQRWRRKYITKRQGKRQEEYHCQQTTNQAKKSNCKFQRNASKGFFKHTNGECSFVQRTTVYCKSLNSKVLRYIGSVQRSNKDSSTIFNHSEGPRQYGRKVEIVAKLLSSTFIAKAKGEEVYEQKIRVIQSCTNTRGYSQEEMTITDIHFLELREEYPDLNSEIRSILTARAQDGATIPEIRDDYRKLTGINFPIYEDITEFLLTIPYVTAYCTEKGTRIFNILPMDKTKHIHDMVMHQKIQPEPIYQKPMSHSYYRERERNNNYQPSNWRQNTNRRFLKSNADFEEPLKLENGEKLEQLVPSTESNLSRDGSEGLYENNCFYQDNCNYLYNRICNRKPPEHITSHLMEKFPQILSRREIMLPFNHGTTTVQQSQPRPYHPIVNNFRNAETPVNNHIKPLPLPVSSGSSSPNPKSWCTNESAFTESDYEAHLLDFLLLGDDFFLYMARMELRCKFKKNQRILQSGLCVSGQTIGAAIKRINSMNNSHRRSIILNIGSVDIMQGRQLIQIEHDFRELISTMLKKGIKPILTTLAPLANYSHNSEIKRMLHRFNEFIKKEGQQKKLIVIDIWKCLVNEKRHVLFDCYQNEPRNVTGASESYLFWNKIGRQRVLQLIESQLEY